MVITTIIHPVIVTTTTKTTWFQDGIRSTLWTCEWTGTVGRVLNFVH